MLSHGLSAALVNAEEAAPSDRGTAVPERPAAVLALLPRPLSIEAGESWLRANENFRIEWLGRRDTFLSHAVSRFQADVSRRTGRTASGTGAARLVIDCRGNGAATPAADLREDYSLVVTKDAATLTADAPAGVLRGLATLRQAVTDAPGGFAVPAMVIEDAPRFAWRGVMIDVARHFYSLEALRRQVDMMERVKLNVLHLHLSDDEGFRVESRLYPKLHQGSAPAFYTQTEIRELVAYAADRGVRIVPEFDVPGHALAMLRAYPEYASGPVDGRDEASSAALDPSNAATFTFLDRLFGEMASLFPDRHFHVGGDEISSTGWKESARIQQFMRTNNLPTVSALASYFFERVRKSVAARGQTVVGWEEVARTSIPNDVVVQAWRSSSAVARVTSRGNRVIATCGYFLDKLWAAEDHYRVDPADPTACGLTHQQYADAKAKGLPAEILSEDLVIDPSLSLSPEAEALVLGGEAALWSELVTEEMLDGRLWPSAAAIAERLWSPAALRDGEDMQRRLMVAHDGLRVAGLLDDANRRKMAARLAPGESEPVALLLDLVAPVRNHAHDRLRMARLRGRAPVAQELNELADAASPNSLVALRFRMSVERFVSGDRSGVAALKAELRSWQDNHERFRVAARDRPLLEVALPISADVSALSTIGLEAITAIERGKAPGTNWRTRAKDVLDRQAAAERASSGMLEVATMEQPPADLLISITPGVRMLAEAAARLRP